MMESDGEWSMNIDDAKQPKDNLWRLLYTCEESNQTWLKKRQNISRVKNFETWNAQEHPSVGFLVGYLFLVGIRLHALFHTVGGSDKKTWLNRWTKNSKKNGNKIRTKPAEIFSFEFFSIIFHFSMICFSFLCWKIFFHRENPENLIEDFFALRNFFLRFSL